MLKPEYMKQVWHKFKPLAMFIMSLIIFLAIGQYLISNWRLLTEHQWQLNWVWLAGSIITMLIFWISVAKGWQQTVAWNGATIPPIAGLWVWTRSSLARYLPTPIWETGSRIYMTTKFGTSWREATFSYGAGLAGQLAGAFAVALCALQLLVSIPWFVSLMVSFFTILVVLPALYLISHHLLGHLDWYLRCSLHNLVKWSGLYGLAFLLYGVGHIFILYSLGVSSAPLNLVIGVSAFAWAVGTLNVLSPSGLGTREFVLIYGLNDYANPPELIALSVISRLIAVFAELALFFSVYWLVEGRFRVRQAFLKRI